MVIHIGEDVFAEGLTTDSCVRIGEVDTDAAANACSRAGAYRPRARRTAILAMSEAIAQALKSSLTLLFADS
jgi:hypothetical protein